MQPQIIFRQLGLAEYAATLRTMSEFTDARGAETPDEIWFLEHPPVFTLGINADRSHVLSPGQIPVVQVDRGGQVTYHGPGQVVAYTLLDLKRARLSVRGLVSALENAMIDTAAVFGVTAVSRRDAPGIYCNGAKLGSIGLRIRRGCSYHGLALNVDMDLAPFARIDPCGFSDMPVTQLIDCRGADLAGPIDARRVMAELEPRLLRQVRSAT